MSLVQFELRRLAKRHAIQSRMNLPHCMLTGAIEMLVMMASPANHRCLAGPASDVDVQPIEEGDQCASWHVQ